MKAVRGQRQITLVSAHEEIQLARESEAEAEARQEMDACNDPDLQQHVIRASAGLRIAVGG
jgi:hypothetical protein